MKTAIQISFDFDGVLVKSPFARCALVPALEILARDYISRVKIGTTEAVERLKGLVMKESDRRAEAGRYVEAYDWDGILASVADRLNLSCDLSLAEMVRECSDRITETQDSSLLYPNAKATLKIVKERGARVLLLTNGLRVYQEPFLKSFGLEKYFDEVFTADRLRSAKPCREAFERAFRRSFRAKIHVGDRLIIDVSGAKNAGITSIWLHRGLPDSFLLLDYQQRNDPDILEPILSNQLNYEGFNGARGPEFFPDVVIGNLDEIIPALEYLEQISH
jgi:HAD superfamily hydrolase (TIGR01549 family)